MCIETRSLARTRSNGRAAWDGAAWDGAARDVTACDGAAGGRDRALGRVFGAARYEVGGVVFRVGRRSPGIDRVLRVWGVREAVLLGAWNPRGRRRPVGWNRARHRALLEVLRRERVTEGRGGLGAWWEDHVLAAVPPGRGLVLARRFRQAAVVLVARGRPVRLWMLRPWRGRPGG